MDDYTYLYHLHYFLCLLWTSVKMYVEDKKSHQGPITFSVTPDLTVGALRDKVR